MINVNDIKNGMTLIVDGKLCQIIEFQHVKPGKGGAFVRTKLKSLTTGRILENTFNAGVKVVTARVERRKYQFIYKDGDSFTFMNIEDYEQVTIDKKMIENELLLKDGQDVYILYHTEKNQILGVELPLSVEMTLTEVEEGEKGNTVTRVMKKARTETGLEVLVPLFIKKNDIIKIDTRTGNYIERVTKK